MHGETLFIEPLDAAEDPKGCFLFPEPRQRIVATAQDADGLDRTVNRESKLAVAIELQPRVELLQQRVLLL